MTSMNIKWYYLAGNILCYINRNISSLTFILLLPTPPRNCHQVISSAHLFKFIKKKLFEWHLVWCLLNKINKFLSFSFPPFPSDLFVEHLYFFIILEVSKIWRSKNHDEKSFFFWRSWKKSWTEKWLKFCHEKGHVKVRGLTHEYWCWS